MPAAKAFSLRFCAALIPLAVAACGAQPDTDTVPRFAPQSPGSNFDPSDGEAGNAQDEGGSVDQPTTNEEPATRDDGSTLDQPDTPANDSVEDDVDDDLALDQPSTDQSGQEDSTPVTDEPGPEPEPEPVEIVGLPTAGTSNLFTELLGISPQAVDDKVREATNRVFGIGTGEPDTPQDTGYRLYYELPQDENMAFIWVPDTQDIRSEGMSYGMMIAVQMDMQTQFDRLWRFAERFMQFPANSGAWSLYFRWQGRVNTQNPNNWGVNYGDQTGPAPDGEEYFAAALYLADRRWGSNGAINYEAEADALTSAMLHNQRQGSRTAVINEGANMVVFYPNGNSANFSDPSYHLPAFYDLFALDGPPGDAQRWRELAEESRRFFVRSAHPQTGLHPDYANFDGTPNGGSPRFQYDAWRVVMNMGVDYAWFSRDDRMRQQTEKYHAFFGSRLDGDDVENQLYDLDGSNGADGGSTALTATLAAGALASQADNRERFVENLWNIGQQQGFYRYYQETVYLLGLLATAGRFGYEWEETP